MSLTATLKQKPPPVGAPAQRRILIVDDHPILRDGLRCLLEAEPDLMICGESDGVKDVVALVASSKPDLVTVDIALPGVNGVELIKDLLVVYSHLRILVVSTYDEALYAERVLRAGAKGYVMKQAPTHELLSAIRQLLNDQIYLSPALSTQLLKSMMTQRPRTSSRLESLSDRELEIVQLMGRGYSTREIAQALGISSKTVESHRGKMRQKLGLKNGAELVRYALANTKHSN